MSFILIDCGNRSHDLQINVWHWRTVLKILSIHNALLESTIERMGIGGIGTRLEKAELDAISVALKKVILTLAPEEWIFPDGTVTKYPKDPELLNRLGDIGYYRTNRAILEKICEFCDTSNEILIS